MIPRYSRPDMEAIWTDESRFTIWLEIETLALERMVEEGLAPKSALDDVKKKGRFTVDRVLDIEAEVKHDVIAFLTNVAENVGPSARFLHRGMTSSDVLDTTLAVQLKRSGELILAGIKKVQAAVKKRALEHKKTPCIGRSHGIHAEPTTFGLKLISWYSEMRRHEERIEDAIKTIAVGKIAGAVGTYASVSPEVEAHVLSAMGLTPETVPTQIVHRDRHAAFFSALSLLASSVERFAVEIRHLQRTEVGEVEESFGKGQKGSSAMPHKKNPILSENLCGLCRLIRGYVVPAMENVALWHERDISHSSVERIMAPDVCILTDFVLNRFAGIVEGLVVHPEKMMENLNSSSGLVYSGTLLLALVDKGVTREDAYKLVQQNALAARDGGPGFKERVLSDHAITSVVPKVEIEKSFDLNRHLASVELIFERALES